jgi:hypothetical protein
MIDLFQFIDKKVRVTFKYGDKQTGLITKNLSDGIYYPFIFRTEEFGTPYTKSGEYYLNCLSYGDIIHIEEIKPMNKYEELEKQVAEMQKEIDRLKAEDKKKPEITIENASIGDVLDDGCIVVHKTDNMALLAAPAATEVSCGWSKVSPVFEALMSQGFNPSQWFVPSKEQLQLAYENCKQHFASVSYWSSAEVSSTNACFLNFGINGTIGSFPKSLSLCVRAFRCVSF